MLAKCFKDAEIESTARAIILSLLYFLSVKLLFVDVKNNIMQVGRRTGDWIP